MYKPYDCGLLVGRFQTFHIGHQSLVEAGMKLCDRMIILVGSAQECGTERNPFNIKTRMDCIEEIYGYEQGIQVYALSDLTNENDITTEWGKYLLKEVKRYIHKNPELMVYGNDEARSRWFEPDDIKDTSEFIIPRSRIPISATQIRQLMVEDNREEWVKWVNPKLHKMYDRLRSELMEVDYYAERRCLIDA